MALASEEGCLTYGELAARAGHLAQRLAGLGIAGIAGIGPERLVGICLERSFEMVTALVAVLAAGGGYVPLDPELPAERLALMTEDAGLAVIVTQESLAGLLADRAIPRLLLERGQGERADGGAVRDLPAPSPEQTAYVLYTSGSTGRPKGVAVPTGPSPTASPSCATSTSPRELASCTSRPSPSTPRSPRSSGRCSLEAPRCWPAQAASATRSTWYG